MSNGPVSTQTAMLRKLSQPSVLLSRVNQCSTSKLTPFTTIAVWKMELQSFALSKRCINCCLAPARGTVSTRTSFQHELQLQLQPLIIRLIPCHNHLLLSHFSDLPPDPA